MCIMTILDQLAIQILREFGISSFFPRDFEICSFFSREVGIRTPPTPLNNTVRLSGHLPMRDSWVRHSPRWTISRGHFL